MKAIIYWIIVCVFTFIATILGFFLVPFLEWTTSDDLIFVVFIVSVVLLALSIALLVITGNRNIVSFMLDKVKLKSIKEFVNKLKVIAMVILPISLSLTIPIGIHMIRFETCASSRGDYLVHRNTIYSKFGIPIIKGTGDWNWIIAYDGFGNELLVNYDYSSKKTGCTSPEFDIDSDGKIKKNYNNGLAERSECDVCRAEYVINIYYGNGRLFSSIKGYRDYTYNSNSSYGYEYNYCGNHYQSAHDLIREKIEEELISRDIETTKTLD